MRSRAPYHAAMSPNADPAAADLSDDLLARLVDLERLIDALAEAETVAEVAAVVAHRGAVTLGASGGLVGLLDEDGTTLEVAAAFGYPPDFLATWHRVDLDAPLL